MKTGENDAAMLCTLRIRNLALVDDLTIELSEGYNAITGETGAGKSILLGALTLVLGGRADRTMIRSGTDQCTVEAVFGVRGMGVDGRVTEFLEENGLERCEEGQLLLRRLFSGAGTNRQFINGTATTLQVLGRLGDMLVDLHGPHDHQSLLAGARQLELLDAFGGLEGDRQRFGELLRARRGLEEERAGLVVDDAAYARELDLLRHQVREIGGARLRAGEEAELEPEYRRASNAARLIELSREAMERLTEGDSSLTDQAGGLGRTLQELKRLDPEAECLGSLHEQAMSFWRDLQSDLSHYLDRVEVDPERLAQMQERLSLLQDLKRKYGGTVEEAIDFGLKAAERLRQLEGREGELARIDAALVEVDRKLVAAGAELTAGRRKVIPRLEKLIVAELKDLDFRQSRFEVGWSTVTWEEARGSGASGSGLDAVEFLFAPNPGEPMRPLRLIASSGELARVMLAVKTVLAAQDRIPVLVFDEVDANVGGETAVRVGEKMRRLGERHQVLCVTHLAPVAASAGTHHVVTKAVKDGRTLSAVARVEGAERVAELARMLGGAGRAAEQHAEELLGRMTENGGRRTEGRGV